MKRTGKQVFSVQCSVFSGASVPAAHAAVGARTTLVGEEGTLEDYHEEVEAMVTESQEEAQEQLPD